MRLYTTTVVTGLVPDVVSPLPDIWTSLGRIQEIPISLRFVGGDGWTDTLVVHPIVASLVGFVLLRWRAWLRREYLLGGESVSGNR